MKVYTIYSRTLLRQTSRDLQNQFLFSEVLIVSVKEYNFSLYSHHLTMFDCMYVVDNILTAED